MTEQQEVLEHITYNAFNGSLLRDIKYIRCSVKLVGHKRTKCPTNLRYDLLTFVKFIEVNLSNVLN